MVKDKQDQTIDDYAKAQMIINDREESLDKECVEIYKECLETIKSKGRLVVAQCRFNENNQVIPYGSR